MGGTVSNAIIEVKMKKILLVLLFPTLVFAQHPYFGIAIRDSASLNYYISVAEADQTEELIFTIVDSIVYGATDDIPSNVILTFNRDGCLAGRSNTLTILGKVDAPIQKIFDSTITIALDTGVVDVVYPEWWGLTTDSTDDVTFDAMWSALPAQRRPKIRLTGDYYFSNAWNIAEASSDSVPKEAIHIDAYGSAIWSEADTTFEVDLGWYTQGEAIHIIEGLRIFGNGNEGGTNDTDAGTNIGIFVNDVSNLKIVNCAIRNCGDAIVVSHSGPGTTYTPYCDAIHILECVLMCNNQGIVFRDDDPTVSITSDFDHSVVRGNRILIAGGDADTTDACIKIEDSTRVSRSVFADNMLWTTDSTVAVYIGGAIGGTQIDIWHEATNGNVGKGAATIYISDEYEEATSYGYVVNIRQTSGSPVSKVRNYSKKRFHYTEWLESDEVYGMAWTDITGNVVPIEQEVVSATNSFCQGARVLYLFEDEAQDTIISDISGNGVDLTVNTGTTRSTIFSHWFARSLDGSDDYMTSAAFALNGNVMIIAAILPDSANTSATAQRVFKWYQGASDLAYLNAADGSNQSVFEVTTSGGTSTVNHAETYSSGDALVYGCIIDTVNSEIEMWLNGHLLEDAALTGTLTSSTGTCAIGAEWGGASLHSAFDIAFFGVYPYVNKRMLKEISKSLLVMLGGNDDDYYETYEQYKGTDIASATNMRLGSGNAFDITGTTQIDSIDVTSPQETGTIIYLQFDSNPQVTDGANLKLAGNFNSSADDILVLIRIGDIFYEVSRSAN